MLRFVPRDAPPFEAATQAALRPCEGTIARLLCSRGITGKAQAEAFLNPRLEQLHDPMLLNDMEKALRLMEQAKQEQWPTVVYGDYDVDGMCATTLMTQALRAYGVQAEPHVPLRAEGYGLNEAAVEELAQRYRLMVTVDLGITNAAEVALAKKLGMATIVTDHHQLGLEDCPGDAVLNPLLNGYPFPRLCGTGVAFKVACALLGLETACQWLDLAALATVADIVPLRDENRVLVALGLPEIGRRPGLKALVDVANCRMPADTDTLGFQLGPRLNAAGRLADANDGVRLLMTDDPAEAETLARRLDGYNTERKQKEAAFTAEAEKQAERHDFVKHRVLFVMGHGWHVGVVGLVAGRLNHRYGVPVCALSEEEGVLHGSLRGVKGVNIARCLQSCDALLTRYGGHEMAAGVTLPLDNYDAFRETLEHAVQVSAPEEAFLPAQEYDLELRLEEADDRLMNTLERMRPFGCENPAPVFLTRNAQLARRRACGQQGAHLQLTLRQDNRLMDGIAFGMGQQAARLPDRVDAAYTLAREEFMGRVSIKAHVAALRPSPEAQRLALLDEPEAEFDNALLSALRLVLNPPEKAGKTPPNEEKNTVPETVCAENSGALPGTKPARAAQTGKADAAAAVKADAAGLFDAVPAGPLSIPSPLLEQCLAGYRGTLFVAYTRNTALRFLQDYGQRVDLARGVPSDPRCFHTLLIQPELALLRGSWSRVVLLDGPLTAGEPALWARLLPEAHLLAGKPGEMLRLRAGEIDAGDAAYRGLYKLLRRTVCESLRRVAEEAALTEAQTLAGLCAFHALGLIRLTESPFGYALCEAARCSLSDSPVLGALRALSGKTE